MSWKRTFLVGLVSTLACDSITDTQRGRPGLVLVALGLDAPVLVTAPPEDVTRLFVVEQSGRIRVIRRDTLLARPFLDLRSIVRFGPEQGLLGLAFHPHYARNGRLYVHYSNAAGDTRVVRYNVSPNPDSADAASGDTVFTLDQLNEYHQGGMLAFGPDGYLYVGMGDGALGRARDLTTLMGKMLRLDVDGGAPYAVPAANPFVGRAGARGEIWASGLRNPWRFSFDRRTGDLFIGDVGQETWEEIDVQPAGDPGGQDYGWNTLEGTHCYNAPTCDASGLTQPAYEYSHADGCAVIGGYVYRGPHLPEMVGRYFFSDLCSARVWTVRYSGGAVVDLQEHTAFLSPGPYVTSFGEDALGNLYIMTQGGRLYRIERVE